MTSEPESVDVFRITYRLLEDLRNVRISHGNRIREVLPRIPPSVLPPRGHVTWESFFKVSAEILEQEEHRVLGLAHKLLLGDPIGVWTLGQRGIGTALGVSILGEVWPIGLGCRLATEAEVRAGVILAPQLPPLVTEARAMRSAVRSVKEFTDAQLEQYVALIDRIKDLEEQIPAGAGDGAPFGFIHGRTCRFRTVGRLWAYGGLDVRDGKAPRRQKGVRANWNWRLRTRCWLFTQSALRVQGGGPWRECYDRRKAYEWAKVGGDPRKAPPMPSFPDEGVASAQTRSATRRATRRGSALNPSDAQAPNAPAAPRPIVAHSRALRYTMKCLLRDLWRVAHGLPPITGSPA